MLLLLSGTEGDEGRATERDVGLHGDADRGVGAADLLQRQVISDEVTSRSAVLLRDGHPHEAQIGHLRNDVVREHLPLVQLCGARTYLLLRVLVGEVAPPSLLTGKIEVHRFLLRPQIAEIITVRQVTSRNKAAISSSFHTAMSG
jgi:hypothetical protein